MKPPRSREEIIGEIKKLVEKREGCNTITCQVQINLLEVALDIRDALLDANIKK